MSNWNYRVIRKHCAKSGMVTLQIHEVYYAEDGSVDCWTQQPVEPLGTSEPQLRNDVHAFLAAFRKPLLEEKLVLGQLQLVEEKNSQMVLDDLRRDYLSRINRASGYLFQMLGNHLLLKQNPSLAKAYDQVDRALAELCDAVEASVVRQKVG